MHPNVVALRLLRAVDDAHDDSWMSTVQRVVSEYPAVSFRSPVSDWVYEVRHVCGHLGDEDLRVWVACWMAHFRLCEGNLAGALEAMVYADDGRTEVVELQQLFELTRWRLEVRQGHDGRPPWEGRTEAPAGELIAALRRLAETEALAVRQPKVAREAWRLLLSELPERLLGLRWLAMRELARVEDDRLRAGELRAILAELERVPHYGEEPPGRPILDVSPGPRSWRRLVWPALLVLVAAGALAVLRCA